MGWLRDIFFFFVFPSHPFTCFLTFHPKRMSKLPSVRTFQAIQHSATQEQHNITTITDLESGDQVVLWDDILLVFEDARFARDHIATIPFLRGDNFQE